MDLFNPSYKSKPPFSLPQKEGYSYSFDEEKKLFSIQIPNGELLYAEHFFDAKISQRTVEYFLENNSGLDPSKTNWRSLEKTQLQSVHFKNIAWQHQQIRMFGKSIYEPRYTAWYGDKEAEYSYSGIQLKPQPWNKGLLFIKKEIEQVAGTSFNSVLLNWYRDGSDHMGWHADDEKELGVHPVIASANFGAERRFLFRRKDDKREKIEFRLQQGSLLVMRGALQHHWQHALPKTTKVLEDRFNLTFRRIGDYEEAV